MTQYSNPNYKLDAPSKYLEKSSCHYINTVIIDYGAGMGRNSKYFSDLGFNVIAVEIEDRCLKNLRKLGLYKVLNLDGFTDTNINLESFLIVWRVIFSIIDYDERILLYEKFKSVFKKGTKGV